MGVKVLGRLKTWVSRVEDLGFRDEGMKACDGFSGFWINTTDGDDFRSVVWAVGF